MCTLQPARFVPSVHAAHNRDTGTVTLRGALAHNSVLAQVAHELAYLSQYQRDKRLQAMVAERLVLLKKTLSQHKTRHAPTVYKVEISWQNNENGVQECVITLYTHDFAKANATLAQWAGEFMLVILLDALSGQVILADTAESLRYIRWLTDASLKEIADTALPAVPSTAAILAPTARYALPPAQQFRWFSTAASATTALGSGGLAGTNLTRLLGGLMDAKRRIVAGRAAYAAIQ